MSPKWSLNQEQGGHPPFYPPENQKYPRYGSIVCLCLDAFQVLGSGPTYVCGTPGYMAPEVIAGKRWPYVPSLVIGVGGL